jgi:hypothetical protein
MSVVTRSTLEESAFVKDTIRTAYVDPVLYQTLPVSVKNDRLS